MNRLSDQIALITNAHTPLGQEIARQFSDEGARVVLFAPETELLSDLAADIEEAGGESLIFGGTPQQILENRKEVEQTIREFGQVDILVDLEEISVEKDRPQINDHLLKQAAMAMRENEQGTLVVIASVRAADARGLPAAREVQKEWSTRVENIARENRDAHVACNLILPPAELEEGEDSLEYGKPEIEEVASMALFLAAREGQTLSGQILRPDFGASLEG